MTQGLLTAAYIAASILFILALGGLSHPESARRGNVYGITGMVIALTATIWGAQVISYAALFGIMAISAIIGIVVAARVQMTAMPELVAMLHSFVGLAAVLVGFANYMGPSAHFEGVEKTIHEVEIYLGVLIGGVTFTGSVIAFGKLHALITSKPLALPARHW
jgi:NAD(P) transhydrogenase subunit beta